MLAGVMTCGPRGSDFCLAHGLLYVRGQRWCLDGVEELVARLCAARKENRKARELLETFCRLEEEGRTNGCEVRVVDRTVRAAERLLETMPA